MALSAAGHHEAAIQEIDSIAANPKNPLAFFYRGRVLAFARNYADATVSFKQARELDPNSATFAFNLAAIYDQLGCVDDAIGLLETGPPQWRSVPFVRLWLALSYALAGRKNDATAEFAAFRALAPKFTLAIERRFFFGYFEPEFFNRIVAMSGEYGIPEK